MRSSAAWAEAPSTPAPKEIYNHRVYMLAIIASMGAIMFGYDLAFIGTAITLAPFKRDFGLDDMTESQTDAFAANIVSLLQAGCFFGSLAAAPISDRYGRKIVLAVTGLVFCVGSAMQAGSGGSKGLIFAGRVIGGLGVGSASMLVPLYIAEMAPPSIRGRLVGVYEIGVQFGTLIGFWINYGVHQDMAPNSAQWVFPFAFQLIPGGLLTLGMFFVPESPRWAARTKGRDETIKILTQLRNIPDDHPYLQEEATAIVAQIEHERAQVAGKGLVVEFKELCRRENRRQIITGILIFVFMQMAGSNAINYYSPRIFKSIGLKGTNTGLISTGVYGIVRFVTVCFAMYFFVDRFGRTKLLMIGSIGMAICMYYVGGFVTTHPSSKASATATDLTAASTVAAVAIYVYAVFFCISWAGIPWIYCSEIFPTRIRSLAVALCTATHWLMIFMIARSTPYMVSNIGGGAYFLFAACMTVAVPFVWFFMPETKGKKLEDMDGLFLHIKRGRFGRIVGDSQGADSEENMDEEKATVVQVEKP